MGRHTQLLDAASDIRQGIADLKSKSETPDGLRHRRSLERRKSISQAERHMFDFDRIVWVRLQALAVSCKPHSACCATSCAQRSMSSFQRTVRMGLQKLG